jgi:stage V sporulation protein B
VSDKDDPTSAERAPAREDDGRRAGLGLIFITFAKVFFIITGFTVALALPRFFGSEEVFGLFSVVFGAASILNNVLIASTIQTVSKMVSEDESRAAVVLRHGLTVQLAVGLVIGGTLVLGAPVWAEFFFRKPAITPLVRVAGAVAFSYSLYAALVGYVNGRRRFLHQAALDVTFSTLRTIGLVGGAALGIGALGAMGGFGSAACGILVIAVSTIGIGTSGGPLDTKRWLRLLAPIWLYQFCLQGLMQGDLLVLNYAVTDLARASGLAERAAADVANVFAGHYRAAQTFAFVPYQLILSVTFIVFPFVSRATTLGDREAAKRYIQNAMRFSFLVLLAMGAPIAGAASGVLRIAYPEPYLAGADALAILVVGQVAFALFVIGATILTGSGRAWVAAAIACVAVVVVVAASFTAIRLAGLEDRGALAAAAIGTSIGTGLAFALVGFTLWRGFGAFIPIASAARGLLAAGAAFATARFIPHGSAFGSILALAGGFFVYLIALAIMLEVRPSDLGAVRAILARRSKRN